MVKEQLAARLSELLNSSSFSENLCQELSNLVSITNATQVAETLQSFDSVKVFQRLHSASSNDEVSDLLRKLLRCLSPSLMLTSFQSTIMQGLNHNNPRVREITLQELERCTKNEVDLAEFIHHPDIVCQSTKLLNDSNLSVAKFSITILTSLGKSPEGVSALLHPPVKTVIDEILARGSDTKRMRVYDVLITICCEQPTALPLIALEYSMRILSELESEDILLQLNCIEILTKLALTNHGLEFLEHQGVIDKFRNILLDSSDDSMATFLFPGILKFFGNVGRQNPQLLVKDFNDVLHYILSTVESDDPAIKGVAIETIGIIGTKASGKIMLDNFPGTSLGDALHAIGRQAESGTQEMKARALDAIVNLLHLDKSEATAEMQELVDRWFRKFSYGGTLRLLLTLAKQPFMEIRCAALIAIKNIAAREWGQKLLTANPGFVEYLLDRSTEKDKAGKENKYAIAVEIVKSETSGSIFDSETMEKLTAFCKDGPFYVGSVTEVAFEQA